jgi:hypothetical protein
MTDLFSSFLDNASTYLIFHNGGRRSPIPHVVIEAL